jgi:hydrogenase maturation factor
MGSRYLVAKADPITFASDEIGWYAVQVTANDLATMGATPRWFLATVLLPADLADAAMAGRIFDQILTACATLEIALVGGHTEVTYGLTRPIVMGTLLGEVDKDRLVTTAGATPGDAILLTKGFPIEATAIIAREKRADLVGRLDQSLLDRAANFLYDPGISVLRDAQIALGAGGVTSMHDPTEGGVATALWELSEASGHPLEITIEAWPVLPEGQRLCALYGLDPLGAIASGALLLTVRPEREPAVCAALRQAGIPVYTLGRVMDGPPDVFQHGRLLPCPPRDEIARLFG